MNTPLYFSSHKFIRSSRSLRASIALLGVAGLVPWMTRADGLYRDGVGVRSASMAGADVAWASGPLSAMGVNPAGLALEQQPTLELSLQGALADGHYSSPVESNGKLDSNVGIVPEGAFATKLGSSPFTLGLAVIPDTVLKADWSYYDAPGGIGGVSYGVQPQHSEITVLRSAVGLSANVGSKWSLGGSVGLLYNRNVLEAPYIFQSQPALAGAKTLLDLKADGIGVNGQFGLIFRPATNWQFGASYTTPSTVDTTGDASGNATAQLVALGAVPAGSPSSVGAFHYDADVKNHFPQIASVGGSWQAEPCLRLALQVDWIGWKSAFDRLAVNLKNGDNSILNGAVGGTSMQDNAPLDWQDRFVYRAGLELAATKNISLRAGYSYGKSPVPDSTLTPLTAAISEHTVAAGVGYTCGRYEFDLGYQCQLPASRSVGTSLLKSGEYDASHELVTIHWVGVSAAIKF